MLRGVTKAFLKDLYPTRPPSVARHRQPCCASRWGSKSAVEKRIHRLDNGVPIGLFGRQKQTAANERLDFIIAEIESKGAKTVAAALPATPHPLGGAGAGNLGVCDNRDGHAFGHRTAPLTTYFTASAARNEPWCGGHMPAGNRVPQAITSPWP